MSKKDTALKIVYRGHAKHQPDDMFMLASGMKSPYYFNIKNALLDSHTRVDIVDHLIDEIEYMYDDTGLTFDSIGGPANAAYLVVGSIISYYGHYNDPSAFVVRKDVKSHGSKSRIDGVLPKKGQCVLIVEDVITTGGSLIPVINLVEECGAEIYKILCIVDREADGNKEIDKLVKYREKDMIRCIFKTSDFIFGKK